jgi:hypothetical protein
MGADRMGRAHFMHNAPVPAASKTLVPEVARRVIRVQAFTVVRMIVEAAVSLGAAWVASSPALLGFGGDSAVELLSAAIVLRRFYRPVNDPVPRSERHELQAACFSSSQDSLRLLRFSHC